ncbi:hypothetical protein HOLleu_31710 [Holothuria leucospilota]|uniref:Uncharacterized protein n=1 Tax=Holothuria leucospilota TaxID=206669 RepID=A0A9Q1BIG3_HOLLE|nr:hypothetical protein HOLleu_31710 [Holothuria leucospilota]
MRHYSIDLRTSPVRMGRLAAGFVLTSLTLILPMGLSSANLAHGSDGSLALYGIVEDGVVTFNITPWIKNLRQKEKGHKKKMKIADNTDQSSSKRRKKDKPDSGNDAIFKSLLPSSQMPAASGESMDAQNGLESLFEMDVIYLEEKEILFKGNNLVNCLLLDKILVTLSHYLGEYIVSISLCLGRRKSNSPKTELSSSSQVLFSHLISTYMSSASAELQEPVEFLSTDIFGTNRGSTAMVNVCATKLVYFSEDRIGSTNSESICHEIFVHMFGTDSRFLESEVVIVGTHDGKIFSCVLRGTNTYPGGSDHANSFQVHRTLYDLEEPVVLATSIKFMSGELVGNDSPGNNCLLFVGKRGKICVMCFEKPSQADEKVKTRFEERSIKGPVFSPVLLNGDCLFYSTGTELMSVKLEFVERYDGTFKQRNLQVTSIKYPIRNVACLARLDMNLSSEDDTRSKMFMTCSTNGKVKSVTIADSYQSQSTTSMTSAQAGHKMKKLMLSIHDTSKKINNYQRISKVQNSVLSELAKAGHLARFVLERSKEAEPFFVEIRFILQDNGSQKVQIVECKITNKTKWTFGHEWSVCASICGKKHSSPRQQMEHRSDHMTWFSSEPATIRTYNLDNLKPDMFTVFHFTVHDGSQLIPGPYEVKVYLHFGSVFINQLPDCLKGIGGDTGIMLPVCSKRIDVLHTLRPVSIAAMQSWTDMGNQQNAKSTQSGSIAMDTKFSKGQDWLSGTLKNISEEKIMMSKSEENRKGQDVLRTTSLLLNETTLASLNLQGLTFIQWLFQDNHLVLPSLESECSEDSVQLVSPSGASVQITQARNEDVTKTKIQVNTISCQLLAEVWEAIHCRLANSLEGTEVTSQPMTKGKEEQAKLMRSVQILENRLGELRDQLPSQVEENQEALWGIYEEMRKLSLRL